MVEEGLLRKFLPVKISTSDEGVVDRIVDAVRGLEPEGLYPSGILTYFEPFVAVVAEVTDTLGLPGNTAETVAIARNKHRFRMCQQAADIPTPKTFLIADSSQLEQAGRSVCFPVRL
eukprot:3881976-Pyramimonas_sp.AAC.2